MAEVSVTGVVLRRKDAGESDRRLTLMTRELGKVDVTAKGARKSASRLSGVSEPLCAAVFGLASGKRNSYVTQAQPVSSFRGLRTDYDRLSFALALLELYAAVLPYDEPNPEAFDMLTGSLHRLEIHRKPVVAYVWSQTKLLRLSGFQPQFANCVLCGRSADRPLGRLSPQAGGFLCEEHAQSAFDSFSVRREILIGLAKISDLAEPPENLKFGEECFNSLLPFWRNYAEMALPANEALQKHLLSERLNEGEAGG